MAYRREEVSVLQNILNVRLIGRLGIYEKQTPTIGKKWLVYADRPCKMLNECLSNICARLNL